MHYEWVLTGFELAILGYWDFVNVLGLKTGDTLLHGMCGC
jgi:hypothetical protein